MAPDETTLSGWVGALVRIPSVNLLHVGPRSGPPGEAAIASALAEWFEKFGGTASVEVVEDGRPNVYGLFEGRSDRLVCLDVHTDTVTVEHYDGDPFSGHVSNGRVWGRGAVDTKASMGVMLALLEDWHERGLRPEPHLLVVGTIAEEAGGLPGAAAFRDWAERTGRSIDELIVAEPTSCVPIYGHKGGVGLVVTVLGRAAHSSKPHLGANAISAAARLIVALDAEHERLARLEGATEVGNGTLTVSVIAGGTGGNVVPDRCELTVGRRVVPYEDHDEVFDQLSDLVRRECPLPVEIERPSPGSDAFYQPPDAPFVQNLARWASTQPAVAPYGTNALKYHGLARQLAVFGPGSIDVAHTAAEYVDVAELSQLARVYTEWLRPG